MFHFTLSFAVSRRAAFGGGGDETGVGDDYREEEDEKGDVEDVAGGSHGWGGWSDGGWMRWAEPLFIGCRGTWRLDARVRRCVNANLDGRTFRYHTGGVMACGLPVSGDHGTLMDPVFASSDRDYIVVCRCTQVRTHAGPALFVTGNRVSIRIGSKLGLGLSTKCCCMKLTFTVACSLYPGYV